MFIFILFAIITFIFYLKSKFGNENEEILTMITYCLGISTAITGFLLFFRDETLQNDSYYLLFIPFFAYGVFYINKKTKPKSFEIIANQQRYFNEVTPKAIINFYKVRKSIKKDRVETLVNKDSKKLIKENVIVPAFFMDLKSLKLTPIQKIEDLNQSVVFKAVFEKVKGFISAKEAKVNFTKVLEQNDFKAEFFLMSLWEEHTFKFNISLANLEVLATNKNEIELIGALDLLNLNCVKRKGAVLFYKYIEFKNRIKDYVKQENLEINPSEEGFDESYIQNENL
ncbi:hypothetical protein [Helicobacter fennelliae]|uniref:hypothetical protein n=1 Tax=Helicobacter fennelliae TaxID=215 RepID=UPI000DF8CFB0|nr:hypothetical protein [Helicobacter fennelliae]STQ92057.1 Uncharacterised protein [Helicobacter fennelliae]